MDKVFIFAYIAWAFYSGYKMMSGRWEWLDRKAPLNLIVKIVVSFAVGWLAGAFYLLMLVTRFFLELFRAALLRK